MDIIKIIMQTSVGLFMIAIFALVIFPELGKATGQNVAPYILSMIFLGLGLIAVAILSIKKMME